MSALLSLRDISKRFDNGTLAIERIDLDVSDGEFVSLVGPSGCGKSTALRIIAGLLAPDSGTVTWPAEKPEVGFVFQTFNLLARATALHNVELPLIYGGVSSSKRHEMAQQALRSVDLAERMMHKPNELSGGQRQRVAIARALVNHPSILLADEPTGALDSHTSMEIMDLFERLHSEGNTIIVVTHEHDIAERAHRVISIRDGQIERDERIK